MFEAEAALPYLLEEIDGADQLLVGFPAYRTGVVPPGTWQLAYLERFKAHRLLLGSDEHTYIGPAQEMRGLKTAVQLIEKVTQDLDVSPEHVVCYGTSMAASLAALTGLAYGAGGIVLGAPPLAIGTLLGGWAAQERRTGGKPLTSASRLIELGTRKGGLSAVGWGDGLIPSLAAACPRPVKVRLFANPDDFTFPGVLAFLKEQGAWPNVDVEIEVTDEPSHDAVAKAFYGPFLRRVLSEELAIA